MFNSPFQSDYSAEPNFNFHGGQEPIQQTTQQPTQQSTQAQPVKGGVSYSADEVEKMVNNLRVSIMTNPVKVTEPSYIITETQMKQLLNLQGMDKANNHTQQQPQQQMPQQVVQPQYVQQQPYVNGNVYPQQQVVQQNGYQQVAVQAQRKTFKEQIAEATQAPMPNSNNIIDTLGNVTFGTVGRIGHTLTGLVDGVIDVITMGYSTGR